MLWSTKKPGTRAKRVIGFLDVDNLLIQGARPFSPDAWSAYGMNIPWMERMLDNALLWLREIGEEVELRAFLDLDSRHDNAAREAICGAAQQRGITPIHVPADEHGKDQVDAALTADWNARRREMSPEIPFVLFSEDAGFAGMFVDTREERGVYLVLPANHFFPRHVQWADGWGWLDHHAARNRVMSFLLNQDAPLPVRGFLVQLANSSPDAGTWWVDGKRALTALETHPRVTWESEEACIAFLVEQGIAKERGMFLLWYLIYYQVVIIEGDSVRPNPSYQRRPMPI